MIKIASFTEASGRKSWAAKTGMFPLTPYSQLLLVEKLVDSSADHRRTSRKASLK